MVVIIDRAECLRFPFIQQTLDFADLLNDIIILFKLEIFAEGLCNVLTLLRDYVRQNNVFEHLGGVAFESALMTNQSLRVAEAKKRKQQLN